MKKRILIIIYIVVLLICCVPAFRYIYNEIVISCYNRSDYSISTEPLSTLNLGESYIAHYNQGNIYYKSDKFEDAIESYKKALEQNPPEDKECSIRINLALAMLGTMAEDYSAEKNAETSLEILKGARDVLLEKGCVANDTDGHNKTAQKLKDEIDEIIKQLEQQQASNKPSVNKKPDENKNEPSDPIEEKIKNTLREKQTNANKSRKESFGYDNDFNKKYNFDLNGRIW